MKTEAVLACEPQVLTQQQRESYFANGFVVAAGFLNGEWLERMRESYAAAIERSRTVTASNEWYSLQADHSHDHPRIQRIEKLPDQDSEFWEFVTGSDIVSLAADIVGPDVVYRDSMINVKCPGTGGAVAWHQDLPFYPHTNTSTIQILIALYDIPDEQGPVMVKPGSHRGPIYEHYDESGNWTGKIRQSDLEQLGDDNQVVLTCSAGDAIVLHPLTLHSSGANESSCSRPLLIHGMSAADARSYTPMTWGNSHSGELVLGSPARYAHHEDMIIPLPPDWSDGYTSIFEHHQRRR